MNFIGSERKWAETLFGGAMMGDARRTKRLVKLATAMARRPEASVDAACGQSSAAAEGAHRLIRNSEAGAGAIFEGGTRHTAELAKKFSGDILALEDSTTLSYSHSVGEELGDTGGTIGSKNRGWWVHTVMLVMEKNHYPLGPVEQQRWCRPIRSRGRRHRRRARDYREKESFKWERASRAMESRLGTEVMERVISVCDREADVFEYLVYKIERGQRFVVRASWDRKLEGEAERRYLWETMEKEPVRGRCTLVLPQKGGRPKRAAELGLRFRKVALARPHRRRTGADKPIELWAVLVKEDQPAPEREGLEWMLLTSEEVEGHEQAMKVLGHYQARWQIEDWHKAWKTGCRVEARRQQDEANLEKVVVLTAFVAVRLLQLRKLARDDGGAPCDRLLSETEWQCLWLSVENKPLPQQRPDMHWAWWAVGRLGGWKNSKGDGVVGWLLLYRGWSALQERTAGFELALAMHARKDVIK